MFLEQIADLQDRAEGERQRAQKERPREGVEELFRRGQGGADSNMRPRRVASAPTSVDPVSRPPLRTRFDWKTAWPWVVLVAAPWIAFPPEFIPKALLDGGDDLLANIPELVYSAKKLLQGEIFWTPDLWMGHPLLGEPEFATFYLPKLLLLVGSPVVAYAAYLVLHFLAAEFGAYLYLETFGFGRAARVFGALAYAYSGFMLGHRAHTMYVCAGAWTPFVLLLFERATVRGGRLVHLGAALAFAMLPLCGAVQLAVYLVAMIVTLGVARWFFERNAEALVGSLRCLIPGLLVSAVQLAPSYDFSRQLATDMRADYSLDVMHSFHPLLFPTMVIPIPPLDPELYSRAGVVVLCAVGVALANVRKAPSRVRAWIVVAAVAFALALGRYLPPLPRLLHGLPVVGVLRGPARHNFELGLALAVLGAYGVDTARRRGAGRFRAWLVVAGVFATLSWGAVKLAQAGRVGDAGATTLLNGITSTAVLAAVAAFLLWVAPIRNPKSRYARWWWAGVSIAPMLETAWAMRVEAWPNHSALGLIEDARAALPKAGRWVRLLSVSLHRGSVDDLAGNSVLFHPGVQSLQGYSSISYSTARRVLDLDMHGQPIQYHELAYSILPSVYGVTHVVLPSSASGDASWSLGPGDACVRDVAAEAETEKPPPNSVEGSARRACAVEGDATFRYRLQMDARTEATDTLGVGFSYVAPPDWEARFVIDLSGAMLGPAPARRSGPFRLAGVESWGGLMIENHRSSPVEILDAGLYIERQIAGLPSTHADERVYGFPIATHRYQKGIRFENGRIEIDAGGRVGGTMHLPVRAFEMLLDAEATAPLTTPVQFGFEADTKYELPRQWEIAANAFTHRARVHQIGVLPPDIADPKLFVSVGGANPLRVYELSARDALTLRGYANPRRLANGLFLYENPAAAPRAYAVGQIQREEDPIVVRRALFEFHTADLGRKAIVGKGVPENLKPGVVERATFGQRRDEVVVRSDEGPTLLVVNERFDPDWRATIDGAPAPIVPANGFVRGVVVPKGRHVVRFEYRIPRAVWIGLGLCLAGVLAGLLVAPALQQRASARRQKSV